MICPSCHSSEVVKNGTIHTGKPKFACQDCGRQFVENPENKIAQEKKDLIDKLLLERIPLAGIACVAGVSERWLQGDVNRNRTYALTSAMLYVSKTRVTTIRCSFKMSR